MGEKLFKFQAMLPRLNKIHMTESDLFTKVVCKFWPPGKREILEIQIWKEKRDCKKLETSISDAIEAAVKKLRHGAFDTSLYKT